MAVRYWGEGGFGIFGSWLAGGAWRWTAGCLEGGRKLEMGERMVRVVI